MSDFPSKVCQKWSHSEFQVYFFFFAKMLIKKTGPMSKLKYEVFTFLLYIEPLQEEQN